MKFTTLPLPGLILIQPQLRGDERGYFMEAYRHDLFEQGVGVRVNFVQDNESNSTLGVLRGLHFQLPPYAQSKLVRVIEGRVWDVAVDIRLGSPTYGRYLGIELSADNKQQLFIPRGFAHGFVVLSETATFVYKVDNYYAPEYERGIVYNDAQLKIDWRLAATQLRLSAKDKQLPRLADLAGGFDYHVDYYA